MEELNIFLSSPGDVKEERQLVKKLAERITKRSNNRIKLNAYAWEDDQLFLATEGGYQTNIVRTSDPADFDLLICILWSRLGTPLNPHDFNQAQYMSGTEYEYLRATQAYKERKARGEFPVKPDVLIFRRTDKVRAPELDPDDPASMERFKEFSRQIEAVNTFFRTHIEPDYNNAAYHRYSLSNKAGPGSERNDFADKIEHCLIEWIKTKFKERGEDPEMAMRLKSWHESPFRALEVFEEEHQAIYFGRDNVQQRVMDQFKSQYEHGSPFVLIYGASGSGKSSLLRAGLFPKFRGGGLVDGVSSWNIALFVPSKALTPEGKETGADLIRALAESLFSAVPELKNKTTPDMLAAELRTSPSAAVAALGAALETQRDAGREKRNVKSLEPIRVFLGLDQVEEFFTIPSLAGSEIHAFFAALAELVRSQLVGVIGTMRSDFYHRCDKVPALAEMTAGLGSYRLVAPSHAEIGDMIRKPAELAGLRFESDPEKGKLDEVILHEAVKNPEALPLLEYALQLLYEEGHADGLLSHANYQKIGGVEKAIATQAHTTFENLKATSEKEKWNLDDAFDTVFRQLIFLNESSKGHGQIATKRTVLKKELEAAGSGPAKLVEAFCQARLFATDETNLTVAHEALLTRWDRLNGWIERNQEFFREVRFLRQQLEAYENSGKKAGWLLRGQPLEKALALRKQYRRSLNAEELDYIQKSARKARQGRLVIRSLTGLLVVMIAGAIVVRLIWPILRAWHYRTLNAANVAKARVNSLGMKFVEAGTPGVLFSVYDVRVEDWRQFAQSEDYKNKFSDGKKGTADNNGKTNTAWENPFLNYKQSEEAPVVDVSWYDAVAFCEWLTRTDRAAHKIADNENYDLPTDAQWSKAVGLNEPDAGTPKDKDSKVQGYPWGTAWPPPGGAGNYADGLTNDVFPFTSPVGSFASYHYELCDMGGNAWQWCKDNYAGGVNDNDELKVLRGGSWSNSDSDALSSSDRYDGPQADERMNIIGFRCVLVTTP